MSDIKLRVYSGYFVKVAPYGVCNHVGEVDRIEIDKKGRVAICCDIWYSTTTENKVQGGCFYLETVSFIDFNTFFSLVEHHTSKVLELEASHIKEEPHTNDLAYLQRRLQDLKEALKAKV